MKQCTECGKSNILYMGDDVHKCLVRDPDTGKIITNSFICDEHANIFSDDGYSVVESA